MFHRQCGEVGERTGGVEDANVPMAGEKLVPCASEMDEDILSSNQ